MSVRAERSARGAIGIRIAISFLTVLLSPLASADDRCTAQGRAEQARIERDFASNRPARGDRGAEAAWARNLDAALAAAARRAEECTRASRQPGASAAAAREEACVTKAKSQLADLDRKYGGRSLSAEEQTARRREDDRVLEERMACSRAAAR